MEFAVLFVGVQCAYGRIKRCLMMALREDLDFLVCFALLFINLPCFMIGRRLIAAMDLTDWDGMEWDIPWHGVFFRNETF